MAPSSLHPWLFFHTVGIRQMGRKLMEWMLGSLSGVCVGPYHHYGRGMDLQIKMKY